MASNFDLLAMLQNPDLLKQQQQQMSIDPTLQVGLPQFPPSMVDPQAKQNLNFMQDQTAGIPEDKPFDNPYFDSFAYSSPGLSKQEIEGMYKANQDEIAARKKAFDVRGQEIEALKNKPTRVDLSPILNLVDNWTGSNLTKSYKAPESPEERQLAYEKLKEAYEKDRGLLTKEEADMTREKAMLMAKTGMNANALQKDRLRAMGKTFDNERALRNEWRNSQTSKITEVANVQLGKMRQAYQAAIGEAKGPKGTLKAAPGQMALVFAFMKMLDPNSVVRESEYAAAANTMGLYDKLKMLGSKISDGEFLTQDQLDSFITMAEQFNDMQMQAQKQLDADYTAMANRYQVNPKNIIRDFSKTANLGSKPSPKIMSEAEFNAFKAANPNDWKEKLRGTK